MIKISYFILKHDKLKILVIMLLLLQRNSSVAKESKVNLRECLFMALGNNNLLKIASYNLYQSNANIALTKSKHLPKISFGGFAGLSQFEGGIPVSNTFLLPLDQYYTQLLAYGEAGIYLKWLLYDSKRLSLEVEEKKVLSEIAAINIKQRRQDIIYRTALLYCESFYSKMKLESGRIKLKLIDRAIKSARDYYQIGWLSKSKLDQLIIQRFNIEDALLIEEQKYQQYIDKLKLIMNIAQTDTIQLVNYPEIQVNSPDSFLPNNLITQEADLFVSAQELKLEQAKQYNKLNINFETYLRYSTGYSWIAGIGIHLPLFDFGEKKAINEIAKYRYLASQVEYSDLKINLEKSTRESYAKLKLLDDRILLFKSIIQSVEIQDVENIEYSEMPFDEFLIMIQKKLDFLDLKIQYLIRQNEYQKEILNYLKITGQIEVLLNN